MEEKEQQRSKKGLQQEAITCRDQQGEVPGPRFGSDFRRVPANRILSAGKLDNKIWKCQFF